MRSKAKIPIPSEDELLSEVQALLVNHFRSNFASYKSKNPQKGSVKWSREAQASLTERFPFLEKEFVFHRRSKSAFDLYSPPHNLAIELEMFQGNPIYEFHKVLFKMLIAGPSYNRLIMVIPKEPGVKKLGSPFNRISFEAFEQAHSLYIRWMVLDLGKNGWLGTLPELFGLYPTLLS